MSNDEKKKAQINTPSNNGSTSQKQFDTPICLH